VNHPYNFCYICGKYTSHSQHKNITKRVKAAFKYYFERKVGDQNKSWAPHVCCHVCNSGLMQWLSGKRKGMPFAVPMIWRESTNHHSDCYFCMTNIAGLSTKKKSKIVYPDCKSALKPVPHDLDSPVPVPPEAAADESDDNSDDAMGDTDELYEPESEETKPQLLNQEELNDLVRDLSLSKEKAEVLGSRLQQWNLLKEGTQNWVITAGSHNGRPIPHTSARASVTTHTHTLLNTSEQCLR